MYACVCIVISYTCATACNVKNTHIYFNIGNLYFVKISYESFLESTDMFYIYVCIYYIIIYIIYVYVFRLRTVL